MTTLPFYQIHINKTGGTSLRQLLGTEPVHLPTSLAIQKIGIENWNKLFTFSIVRNPFDRMVSLYHYRLLGGGLGMLNGITFPEFIHESLVLRSSNFYNRALMFKPCYDWLEFEGELPLTYIGTFEDLEVSIRTILDELDILQPEHIPHIKATKHAHYSTYYNKTARETVSSWFQKDLDAFEYSFEKA